MSEPKIEEPSDDQSDEIQTDKYSWNENDVHILTPEEVAALEEK